MADGLEYGEREQSQVAVGRTTIVVFDAKTCPSFAVDGEHNVLAAQFETVNCSAESGVAANWRRCSVWISVRFTAPFECGQSLSFWQYENSPAEKKSPASSPFHCD